jgi:hypothetical protein
MTTEMSNPNIIARSIVDRKYVVSTVRLLSSPSFETMVFPCDEQGTVTDWIELDCQQYRTLDEARAGHSDMVQNWTNRS